MMSRSRWLWALGVVLAAGSLEGAEKPRAAVAGRWTGPTPDAMLEFAVRRAAAGGDDALAGLATAHALSDRASAGRSRAGLAKLGQGATDIAVQARWLAAELDPGEGATPPGLVRAWSVLGPFQDTGGGLTRKEGPETPDATWGDPRASYAWGAYEVRWREVPRESVTARGFSLELMIHPRKESCSYLASKVSIKDRSPFVLAVASAGSVRLLWDGVDAGKSEEEHGGLVFDRLAAKIEPSVGEHVLAVKVCSGALGDTGRVRVRAADLTGKPIDLVASADVQLKPSANKQAIVPVATALARVLELGATPSDDRALAAGVVRTLGAADDRRSPRSSGLVDKVATSKTTNADALAMAGWISPFGAARSGWLNLAIERAIASDDKATASFAERRLTVARLSAGWADWAMASLGRAPFGDELDAEARLVRSMVKSGLGIESLRRVALNEMLETLKSEGAGAPVALWQELASLSRQLDAALYARAKGELARLAPEARDVNWVDAFTHESRAAVKAAAAESLASGALTADSELLELADTLTNAGLHDEARAVFERAARLCPNRSGAFSGLAAAEFEAARTVEGTRALERARELEPAEVKYRAEMAYRAETARRQSKSGSTERVAVSVDEDHAADAAYMVEPAVFLARKEKTPAKKGEVFDRQLHWVRAVTFHADRRVSQMIQYAREVVTGPRTQDELYEPIPAEGDDTEILRARVHRASGGVAFAEEQKSEGGRPSIRWPDLKTGDVVEVAIRSWTSGPVGRRGDPPFYFIDYAGSLATHPLLYNEVVVDSPADKPLAVDVLHGHADRFSDETKNGHRLTRMIWDNPPTVPDEPLAPRASEILPTIVGSTFANWKEFREWYQGAV